MIEKCNICGGKVKLFNPTDIYGLRFKHHTDPEDKPGKPISYIYKCLECSATVGCHGDTNKPFGKLADKKTRDARHKTHLILDPIWKKEIDGDFRKGSKGKARKKLYKMLSEKMLIPFKETHIGMFDIKQCRQAYKIILEYKRNLIK